MNPKILKEDITYLQLVTRQLEIEFSDNYQASIEVNTELIKILCKIERKLQDSLKNVSESIELLSYHAPAKIKIFRQELLQILAASKFNTEKVTPPN